MRHAPLASDWLRTRADALRARRTPFVEATVVRAVRPTSAKAGDRALVLPDGTIEGFVGGTCAESSVRLHGLRVLHDREPLVLQIVPGAADEGTDGGMVTVANPCASGGLLEIFLEGVFPPPLVQVHGDAPVARALAGVGQALGYEIRSTSPAEPGPANSASAPSPVEPDAAAVIVASHGRDEVPVLTAALRAGVPYVALVASRRRGGQVAAALDVPAWDRQRVHTPAGLDIGARTPEEIALSIFAEIVSERAVPSRGSDPPEPPAVPVRPMPLARPEPTAAAHGEPASPDGRMPARASGPPDGAGAGGVGSARAAEASPGGPSAPGEMADPVCGMTVAVADATPHLPHDGRMWYFCGPGCRNAFAADPAQYQA